MKLFSILLPLFASAVCVLADVPPACLLNAVNTQGDPGDLSAVCGKEASGVQKAIASLCGSGSDQSVAQSAFIATCSGAGSSVAPYTALSTSSTSHVTAASTATATATATVTSASVTGSATPTATSSAGGNAATDVKQVGSFVAAAIAIAGVVAVL